MNKKIKLFLSVSLLAVALFFSISSFSSNVDAGTQGRWLYNESTGIKVGCASPGSDCSWDACLQ